MLTLVPVLLVTMLSIHKGPKDLSPEAKQVSDYVLSRKRANIWLKGKINLYSLDIQQIWLSETEWWRLTFTAKSLWLMHQTPNGESSSSNLVGNYYYFGIWPPRVGRVTDGTANSVLLGWWGVGAGGSGKGRRQWRDGQRWAPRVFNCRPPRRQASITGNL